jgi:hypothetical protein
VWYLLTNSLIRRVCYSNRELAKDSQTFHEPSKTEANTAGNTVGTVVSPAELSLIAEKSRNSWRPLNAGTCVYDKTVVALVRTEDRRCGPGKDCGAERYLSVGLSTCTRVPKEPGRSGSLRHCQHARCKKPVGPNLFSKILRNLHGSEAAKTNHVRCSRRYVHWCIERRQLAQL